MVCSTSRMHQVERNLKLRAENCDWRKGRNVPHEKSKNQEMSKITSPTKKFHEQGLLRLLVIHKNRNLYMRQKQDKVLANGITRKGSQTCV